MKLDLLSYSIDKIAFFIYTFESVIAPQATGLRKAIRTLTNRQVTAGS